MATLEFPTTEEEAAVLQPGKPIQVETQLEGCADWAEVMEMVRDANELVRLARALIPRDP